MSNARDKANIPALNFSSTGIDDNATSTAITIDSSGDVGINTTSPNLVPWNKAVTLSGTGNCAYELAKGSTLHGALGLQGDNRVELINAQDAPLTFKTGTGFSERMRIDSSGNVGVGTSSPGRALSIGVPGNNNGQLYFQDTGSDSYGNAGAFNTDSNGDKIIIYNDGFSYDGRIGVGSGSNLWLKSVGTSASSNIQFVVGTDVSSSERMRINSTGVGIGTSSPTVDLEVGGNDTQVAAVAVRYTSVPMYLSSSGAGSWIGLNQYANTPVALDPIAFSSKANSNYNTSGINFYSTTSGSEIRFYTELNEAGPTEYMRLDSSGNLKFNSGFGSVTTAYGCRAWVTINGTAGTASISASGGVSSINDLGTGSYRINFATAMPDTNYATVALSRGSVSDDDGAFTATYNDTTTSTELRSRVNQTNTTFDTSKMNVAIFR